MRKINFVPIGHQTKAIQTARKAREIECCTV